MLYVIWSTQCRSIKLSLTGASLVLHHTCHASMNSVPASGSGSLRQKLIKVAKNTPEARFCYRVNCQPVLLNWSDTLGRLPNHICCYSLGNADLYMVIIHKHRHICTCFVDLTCSTVTCIASQLEYNVYHTLFFSSCVFASSSYSPWLAN